MKKLTVEDIQNMSNEEVSELNRKLGMRVLMKFLLFHAIKWVAIFSAVHLSKKVIEKRLS